MNVFVFVVVFVVVATNGLMGAPTISGDQAVLDSA
jgi:hypothetical protein